MKTDHHGRFCVKILAAGFLALSLIGGGTAYAGTEKPGATLVVKTRDGRVLKGELLSVRSRAIELLVFAGASKTVLRFDELSALRIAKKSRFFGGLGIGLLSGALSGGLVGLASGDDKPGLFALSAVQKAALLAFLFGSGGGIIGGIVGAASGIDDTIEFETLPAVDLDRIERKLASKARFRKTASAEPASALFPEAPLAAPKAMAIQAAPVPPTTSPRRKPKTRWHVSLLRGYFYPKGGDQLSEMIRKAGFGDTKNHPAIWIFPASTTVYPREDEYSKFSLKDIRLEYSLTPKLAFGLAYSPLVSHSVWGWRAKDRVMNFFFQINEYGPYFGGRFQGNAYFATVAFMPLPDMFTSKSMLKAGAGLGYANIRGAFVTAKRSTYEEGDRMDFERQALCLMGFVEMAHFFGKHLSLGISGFYKYVPFRAPAGTLNILYEHYPSKRIENIPVHVPDALINAGGFGFGATLGFHL